MLDSTIDTLDQHSELEGSNRSMSLEEKQDRIDVMVVLLDYLRGGLNYEILPRLPPATDHSIADSQMAYLCMEIQSLAFAKKRLSPFLETEQSVQKISSVNPSRPRRGRERAEQPTQNIICNICNIQ